MPPTSDVTGDLSKPSSFLQACSQRHSLKIKYFEIWKLWDLLSEKLEGGRGKTAPLNVTSTLTTTRLPSVTTGITDVLILNLQCSQWKGSDEPSRIYVFTRRPTSSFSRRFFSKELISWFCGHTPLRLLLQKHDRHIKGEKRKDRDTRTTRHVSESHLQASADCGVPSNRHAANNSTYLYSRPTHCVERSS
jgi:hypothetical protein